MRSFKYVNTEKTHLSMSHTLKHTKANDSVDKEQEKDQTYSDYTWKTLLQ